MDIFKYKEERNRKLAIEKGVLDLMLSNVYNLKNVFYLKIKIDNLFEFRRNAAKSFKFRNNCQGELLLSNVKDQDTKEIYAKVYFNKIYKSCMIVQILELYPEESLKLSECDIYNILSNYDGTYCLELDFKSICSYIDDNMALMIKNSLMRTVKIIKSYKKEGGKIDNIKEKLFVSEENKKLLRKVFDI